MLLGIRHHCICWQKKFSLTPAAWWFQSYICARTNRGSEITSFHLRERFSLMTLLSSRITVASFQMLPSMRTEKRRISHKGHVDYTDFCPRKLHWVNGNPCASQLDDCFNCDYQFEFGDDYVLCMGRSLVTSIDDLKKPRKERRPCRTSPVNFKTMADAKLWICPDCGYPLHRVEGKHGSFIGCSNYPWCNFTMPDNSK